MDSYVTPSTPSRECRTPRYGTPIEGTPPRDYEIPCSPSGSCKRTSQSQYQEAPKKSAKRRSRCFEDEEYNIEAAVKKAKDSGYLPKNAEKINTGDGQSNKNAVFKDKEFVYKIALNEKTQSEINAYDILPKGTVKLQGTEYNIRFPKAKSKPINHEYALLKLELIEGLSASTLIANKLKCNAGQLIGKVMDFLKSKGVIYDKFNKGGHDNTEALGNMYLLDDNETIVVIDFEFSELQGQFKKGGNRRNNKKSTRKKKSLKTKLKRRSRRTHKKGGNKCDPTYSIENTTPENPYFEINPEVLRNIQTHIHAEGDDIYYYNRDLTQDDVITELLNKYYNKDNFKNLVRDYINVDIDFNERKCYDIRNTCDPFIIEMGPFSHMQTLNNFNREVIKQITIIIQDYKLPKRFYH
jgi:hypothetical protein